MDVRIGVTNIARELEIELDKKADKEKLLNEIEKKLSESNSSGVLRLLDKRGRTVIVPVEKIAYVELSEDAGDRRVGFVG